MTSIIYNENPNAMKYELIQCNFGDDLVIISAVVPNVIKIIANKIKIVMVHREIEYKVPLKTKTNLINKMMTNTAH